MRKWIAGIGLLIVTALPVLAQSAQDVSLLYGADFQYHFDNREFSASSDKATTSYTEHIGEALSWTRSG